MIKSELEGGGWIMEMACSHELRIYVLKRRVSFCKEKSFDGLNLIIKTERYLYRH
jgi:hypothetical protein